MCWRKNSRKTWQLNNFFVLLSTPRQFLQPSNISKQLQTAVMADENTRLWFWYHNLINGEMHRCVIIAMLIELLIYVSSICILTNGCNISHRLGTDAGVPGMTLLMNDFIDRTPSESNYVNPRAPQYIWRICLGWVMFNRKSKTFVCCFQRYDLNMLFIALSLMQRSVNFHKSTVLISIQF